jgi:hypothetical protein
MIALDEPLPEPSQRVRVDRRGSAESKAAPSHEWGAGGDSGAKRADARERQQDQIFLDDHRDSRSQCVTAIRADLSGGALMHHYVSELIDLLLVLVATWMMLAVIFVIYAYFARLKYPVSESVFGRMVVISFFIITTSIWLPIIVGALALSLIGHLWSRFRTKPRVDSAN